MTTNTSINKMTDSQEAGRGELRKHFEANMLDGDALQKGQMLSSKSVFEYLTEVVDQQSQRAVEVILTQVDPYIDPEFREMFEQLAATQRDAP